MGNGLSIVYSVVLNFLSCVNLWTPEGTHILSVFIPVFIDYMTVVSFTHRHLGLKGCHVTWVTTMCLCERLIENSCNVHNVLAQQLEVCS